MPFAARRLLRGAVASVAAAAALLVADPALAHAPTPAPRTFTAPVDPYASYVAETGCSSTVKPGIIAVRDSILLPTYGGSKSDVLTLRSCSSSDSGHEEGRALDWMMDARVPAEAEHAKAFLSWLLRTDSSGKTHAMARRLGVMYVQHNNKMWRSYRPSEGWQPQYYGGRDCATLSSSYATACHRDHVHISFSWDGAEKRTSYWR